MIDYIIYAVMAALIAAAAVLLIVLHVSPAFGHDWFPTECCGGNDCREIPNEAVELTPKGWKVYNGDVIPFGHRKERVSPDGAFYRCAFSYAREGASDSTICLFVPSAGS